MIAKSAKLVDFAQLLGLWFSPPMFPYQFKGGFGQNSFMRKLFMTYTVSSMYVSFSPCRYLLFMQTIMQ